MVGVINHKCELYSCVCSCVQLNYKLWIPPVLGSRYLFLRLRLPLKMLGSRLLGAVFRVFHRLRLSTTGYNISFLFLLSLFISLLQNKRLFELNRRVWRILAVFHNSTQQLFLYCKISFGSTNNYGARCIAWNAHCLIYILILRFLSIL